MYEEEDGGGERLVNEGVLGLEEAANDHLEKRNKSLIEEMEISIK